MGVRIDMTRVLAWLGVLVVGALHSTLPHACSPQPSPFLLALLIFAVIANVLLGRHRRS
jgi:hypothetical protein